MVSQSALAQTQLVEEVLQPASVEASAQYPVQHMAEVGLQVWPVLMHEAGGTSQKQPVVPLQETTAPALSKVRQARPLQQFASVAHACEAFEQVGGGGPQIPELQTSVALQHGNVVLHDPPVFAHVGGGTEVWQVPLTQVSGEQQSALEAQDAPGALQHVPAVAPGGTVQVLGEQQSAFTVQLPPPTWQAPPPPEVAVLQTWVVESHRAEQQSAFVAQVTPSPTQPPQTVFSKQYPVQHWLPLEQAAPTV